MHKNTGAQERRAKSEGRGRIGGGKGAKGGIVLTGDRVGVELGDKKKQELVN